MKKRVLAMLMAVVMLLAISGCGNSAAESYKTMAQGFIDDRDIQSAIKILEEGIEETKSDELKAMLEELNSAKDDYSSYVGTWAVENIGWEFGGLILDIASEADTMSLNCTLTQSAPASRVAEVSTDIKVSEIVDSVIVIPFDNDGWGNSGKLSITFKDDAIECTFSDLVMDDMAQWGFYEETYELVRFENAHEMLVYTQEEYDELYGEPEETQPTYDTSKASGILAQAGLTEEQFRSQCTALHFETPKDFFVEAGKQYLKQHPEEDKTEEKKTKWKTGDIGISADKWAYYGSEQGYLDSYYEDIGRELLEPSSGDLVANMFEYSSDYIGKYFVIPSMYAQNKGNIDGYIYYQDVEMYIDSSNGSKKYNIAILDYRDDTNYPTIREKERFDAYVVFLGVDSDDIMQFALISLDKVDN